MAIKVSRGQSKDLSDVRVLSKPSCQKFEVLANSDVTPFCVSFGFGHGVCPAFVGQIALLDKDPCCKNRALCLTKRPEQEFIILLNSRFCPLFWSLESAQGMFCWVCDVWIWVVSLKNLQLALAVGIWWESSLAMLWPFDGQVQILNYPVWQPAEPMLQPPTDWRCVANQDGHDGRSEPQKCTWPDSPPWR